MSWIILALTLGASITSIIHGVFMLFGSLSISGAALPGIPSTMLASLPVISAVFALIGGVIAFNQSKWGAFFLFIATGLCVPARDTWIYGGIYFFAALLCFFLKGRQRDDFQDMMYSYDDDEEGEGRTQDSESDGDEDFYYEQTDNDDELITPPAEENMPVSNIALNEQILEPQVPNNEPPRLRRRAMKTCPTCGANVARENHFCPTCGTKLSVLTEDFDMTAPVMPIAGPNDDNDIQRVNEHLLSPVSAQGSNFQAGISDSDIEPDFGINLNSNDGDDMSSTQAVPNYRVLTRPKRNGQEFQAQANRKKARSAASEAASSYQEFSNSKYTKRAKKRKRSPGRKILSMLLLVAAVGGASYFLLGLRKLPPGELPPIARNPEVVPASTQPVTPSSTASVNNNSSVAQPVDIAIAENMLPNFTPDRTPKNGIITGSSVNVRADHSTSSSRVTRLNVNSRVEVLGTYNVPSGKYSGIWYNIRNGKNEGWVYGQYVQPLGSGIPSGYSNALLKSFGNNKSQLVESLGAPSRSTSSSVEWSGLTATLKGEDITRLRLTGANRELQNGLKVGMSQTALIQIMGYPSSVSNRIMQYNEGNKTGISVQLDRNNSISSITVNDI